MRQNRKRTNIVVPAGLVVLYAILVDPLCKCGRHRYFQVHGRPIGVPFKNIIEGIKNLDALFENETIIGAQYDDLAMLLCSRAAQIFQPQPFDADAAREFLCGGSPLVPMVAAIAIEFDDLAEEGECTWEQPKRSSLH